MAKSIKETDSQVARERTYPTENSKTIQRWKKSPEIQFRSPEEIGKRYQEERLTQTLTYLQAHSKFYQRMFEEHHIDINQIKKIEDLQQIPVTTKTDLQLHNDDFICVDKEQIIDYVTTSGTLGDPVTFVLTSEDLDRLSYNVVTCLSPPPDAVKRIFCNS